MVNLVEEWEVLEEYAGDKQGFYQVLADGEAVEIRVAIGRLGFRVPVSPGQNHRPI
ncbi:MAG: hypothetical protein AOA65_0206 [Candidatus Bathyarchaeota archaeon BA1]|nr:MAG: hypothetical protein AOA65_0206 [Candidatus Bathyarchaeota archaeon BA1]